MAKTILALFNNRSDVEGVLDKLKARGFDPKDVSIVMKDTRQAEEIGHDTGAEVGKGVASGVVTGAVIGGIAGILAGTVLPGLGALLIAGPIGAALGLTGAAATTASGVVTGAVAGGLIGALTTLGLTKEEAQHYETRVKEGAILVAVPTPESDAAYVTQVLSDYHASDLKTLPEPTEQFHPRATQPQYADRQQKDQMEDTYQYASTGAKGGQTDYHQEIPAGEKGGTAAHTGQTHQSLVNPIQVQKYLKGVNYPCSKNDLLEAADHEGADQNVLHTLSSLPEGTFNSPNDVSEAIGNLK